MRIETPMAGSGRWPSRRARVLFEREQREPRDDDGIVTAFRDGQVTLRSKRREEGFTNAVQEIGYQGVRCGDLVIHSMDGFAGAIGVSDSDGKSSPVVHCYRAKPGVDARFYAYLLRDLALRGFVTSLAKGIRERSTAFDTETFRSLVVPFPTALEQRAIADFLDRETARIDALITAKRRMIELHGARLEATRAEIVSKGLVHASTSPTASPFFPAIPAHWALRSLDTVVEPGRPIVYGIVQPGPDVEDGVLYVKTGDLPKLDLTCMSRTDPAIALAYRRAALREGDIVVAMRASIGTCALVPKALEGGNLTQGTARVSPRRGVEVRWLFHVLRSYPMLEQMGYRSVGTTYLTLNIADLRKLDLPVPPVSEQVAMARHLDAADGRHAALVESLARSVNLLVERRQALITAAVTGELPIGKVAA